MIIYVAINKANNKIYIGQTIQSLKTRKSQHKYNSKKPNTHFLRAINNRGFDNFDWSIIDTAITLDELNEKEICWIGQTSAFICDDIGYNQTSGGDCGPVMYGKDNPMFGKKRPEIGRLMKKLKTGVPLSEEHKQNIKKTMQKYVGENNPAKRKESRQKISDKAIRRKISIYGKLYDSITDVCIQLDMPRSTVKQRLNSKSERFKGWIKLELYKENKNNG